MYVISSNSSSVSSKYLTADTFNEPVELIDDNFELLILNIETLSKTKYTFIIVSTVHFLEE